MNEILLFIYTHKYFSAILTFADVLLGNLLFESLRLLTDRLLIEAAAGRNNGSSVYKRCAQFVRQSISEYEKTGSKPAFYVKAAAKMKLAGYRSKYAAVVYLLLRYLVIPIMFIFALVLNYPSIAEGVIASAVLWIIIEMVVKGREKKLSLIVQKNIYKIYKFLHNQISSGVKVTDAIKSVYEIIDDEYLKGIMIKLAARYELTLDIDATLEEFKSNFNMQEVETLCVALKQGVVTGDNQEFLARQEDVMFKKYFNFIQAETDNCRIRSVAAAAMFVAIIVLMISVPLFIDASNALGKIFMN